MKRQPVRIGDRVLLSGSLSWPEPIIGHVIHLHDHELQCHATIVLDRPLGDGTCLIDTTRTEILIFPNF